MSSSKNAGRNWGLLTLDNDAVTLRDDGRAPLLSIPNSAILGASGGRGSDVSIDLKADRPGTVTTLRFFIPPTCVGFEDSANPAKTIVDAVVSRTAAKGGVKAEEDAAAGATVGVFREITLSQPAGEHDMTVTTSALHFTSKRGVQFTVNVSNIQRLFMLPVPAQDHKYIAIHTAAPVKVGATALSMIVIALENSLVYPEAQPWVSAMDASAIVAAFPDESKRLVEPTMSGAACEIVAKVLKTVTKVSLFGENADFRGREWRDTCAVRANYKSNSGVLYLLKNFILFLHRPGTLVALVDVASASFDAGLGASYASTISFTITPKTGRDKTVFTVDKKEVDGMTAYLKSRSVNVQSAEEEESGDEGDDEEDDEDDDGDFSDDSESGTDDSGSDGDGSDDSGKKGKRDKKKSKKEKSEGKKKKHHHKDKKEKKDKKSKKRDRDDD